MGDEDGQGRVIRFFLDASLQRPACEALAKVRDDVTHPWLNDCPVDPEFPDERWLSIVGQSNWTVLMRDKRIKYRPLEQAALLRNNVGAFCLTGGAGNFTRWQILELLVRKWPRIEEVVAASKPPYIYRVISDGVYSWLP